jgi:hypothetical protein
MRRQVLFLYCNRRPSLHSERELSFSLLFFGVLAERSKALA